MGLCGLPALAGGLYFWHLLLLKCLAKRLGCDMILVYVRNIRKTSKSEADAACG